MDEGKFQNKWRWKFKIFGEIAQKTLGIILRMEKSVIRKIFQDEVSE